VVGPRRQVESTRSLALLCLFALRLESLVDMGILALFSHTPRWQNITTAGPQGGENGDKEDKSCKGQAYYESGVCNGHCCCLFVACERAVLLLEKLAEIVRLVDDGEGPRVMACRK
jgi:hypothetical protein